MFVVFVLFSCTIIVDNDFPPLVSSIDEHWPQDECHRRKQFDEHVERRSGGVL